MGGPDYLDAPFVAKVRQLADAGTTIISGGGNSGPGWGTLLNPADEAWVIGVGGQVSARCLELQPPPLSPLHHPPSSSSPRVTLSTEEAVT